MSNHIRLIDLVPELKEMIGPNWRQSRYAERAKVLFSTRQLDQEQTHGPGDKSGHGVAKDGAIAQPDSQQGGDVEPQSTSAPIQSTPVQPKSGEPSKKEDEFTQDIADLNAGEKLNPETSLGAMVAKIFDQPTGADEEEEEKGEEEGEVEKEGFKLGKNTSKFRNKNRGNKVGPRKGAPSMVGWKKGGKRMGPSTTPSRLGVEATIGDTAKKLKKPNMSMFDIHQAMKELERKFPMVNKDVIDDAIMSLMKDGINEAAKPSEDIRKTADEKKYVKNGMIYRRSNVVQVWWKKDTLGRPMPKGKEAETWTHPDEYSARAGFKDMVQQFNESLDPWLLGPVNSDLWKEAHSYLRKNVIGEAGTVRGIKNNPTPDFVTSITGTRVDVNGLAKFLKTKISASARKDMLRQYIKDYGGVVVRRIVDHYEKLTENKSVNLWREVIDSLPEEYKGDEQVVTDADGNAIDIDEDEFRTAQKTEPTDVVQIDEPFNVETKEGPAKGEAGDYLAKGVDGEMWPIDQDIFEKTHEFVDEWTVASREKWQEVLGSQYQYTYDNIQRLRGQGGKKGKSYEYVRGYLYNVSHLTSFVINQLIKEAKGLAAPDFETEVEIDEAVAGTWWRLHADSYDQRGIQEPTKTWAGKNKKGKIKTFSRGSSPANRKRAREYAQETNEAVSGISERWIPPHKRPGPSQVKFRKISTSGGGATKYEGVTPKGTVFMFHPTDRDRPHTHGTAYGTTKYTEWVVYRMKDGKVDNKWGPVKSRNMASAKKTIEDAARRESTTEGYTGEKRSLKRTTGSKEWGKTRKSTRSGVKNRRDTRKAERRRGKQQTQQEGSEMMWFRNPGTKGPRNPNTHIPYHPAMDHPELREEKGKKGKTYYLPKLGWMAMEKLVNKLNDQGYSASYKGAYFTTDATKQIVMAASRGVPESVSAIGRQAMSIGEVIQVRPDLHASKNQIGEIRHFASKKMAELFAESIGRSWLADASLSHGSGTSTPSDRHGTGSLITKSEITPEEMKVVDSNDKQIQAFAKKAFQSQPYPIALRAIEGYLERLGVDNKHVGKISDMLAKSFDMDDDPISMIIPKVLPRITQEPSVKGGGHFFGGHPGMR